MKAGRRQCAAPSTTPGRGFTESHLSRLSRTQSCARRWSWHASASNAHDAGEWTKATPAPRYETGGAGWEDAARRPPRSSKSSANTRVDEGTEMRVVHTP